MAVSRIAESELILREDGAIYHLGLLPEDIADDIIVVGDQNRVEKISSYFSSVEVKKESREFITHTGYFNGKRLSVISTGIGCDNIDIVLNELDALVNIDLKTRTEKVEKKSLNIVRIGTSGSLQEHIPVNSFVISELAMGLDGLLHFYPYKEDALEEELLQAILQQTNYPASAPKPYMAKGSDALIQKLSSDKTIKGITVTANGFYGPQGRQLRLAPKIEQFNEKLTAFKHKKYIVSNLEMETSALYGMGKLLGHNCATICVILANRYTKTFTKDYNQVIDDLIRYVLQRLTH
jgi:uridine phosphorylase